MPVERHLFHLAFPVSDLRTSERFYVDQLGARIGRRRADWMDVLLWGHQITLHLSPGDVRREQGPRHFGVVLPWSEWESLAERNDVEFFIGPELRHVDTPREQAKLYLEDPDGYILEIKAYRDVAAALELGGPV
jgi:extradiol dioxygenase family protein